MFGERARRVLLAPGFRGYLTATGFSGIAFSIQQLLQSWLLIGVLLLPADRVGVLQALIGIPGILIMLWGGASADRADPRRMLVIVYALAPLLPGFLILATQSTQLAVWSVVVWGFGMSVVTAFTSPAQQAVLNRVSGPNVQQGVTMATAIGFLVQIGGLLCAGQLDVVGLHVVLAVQALSLGVAAVAMQRLAAMPPASRSTEPVWRVVIDGFKATFERRVIFDVLLINFISSIVNAGAMITVFPFIVKRIYAGNAFDLATMMVVFYAGAFVSNVVMLRFMPLRRPGRVYLGMQLTRVLIVICLWLQPSWWLLTLVVLAWGFNMGVTSTLARAVVQQAAPAAYLGRVLSVFSVGMVGSIPLGALLLGYVIEGFGTLNALLPAMAVSIVLFAYGVLASDLWRYESPPATSPVPGAADRDAKAQS